MGLVSAVKLNAVAPSGIAAEENISDIMMTMGRDARAAARQLALLDRPSKDRALLAMAAAVRARTAQILDANREDVAAASAAGIGSALMDRLVLDEKRLAGIVQGIEDVAALADPVGAVTATWQRPNGLHFERVATPIGVIGMIYESRPGVTADAGALALKSGNAVILRGGSESFRSSRAVHAALQEGLVEAGLPAAAIQMVPTRDRAAVGEMLAGLDGNIDVLVPRGGKGLVARVQAEARVPVFAHLDANNHIYVHAPCDLDQALTIVRNAKLRRTGVCGAVETLLVDRALAATHLAPLVTMLLDAGCAVRGDAETQAVDSRITAAGEEDWATEFLDAIIAVRVVEGLDAALAHIERYSSHHTDGILTDDPAAAERFLREVDSAIVVHNASTQFADGGEFGFGAEIGIATGRMHARGPVGLEQLTSFKYRLRGSGQTRP
ncbi:glutamate-5-semialdehyde dehydrogenase [Terrihabitans sp. B22-R8]|uniref:glutamate-5-semialdehyde dehydrogenase n=1 Tax=Terrihabitans sp. B22-R8 TaxID=3425128 RepID=UPI00403CEB22